MSHRSASLTMRRFEACPGAGSCTSRTSLPSTSSSSSGRGGGTARPRGASRCRGTCPGPHPASRTGLRAEAAAGVVVGSRPTQPMNRAPAMSPSSRVPRVAPLRRMKLHPPRIPRGRLKPSLVRAADEGVGVSFFLGSLLPPCGSTGPGPCRRARCNDHASNRPLLRAGPQTAACRGSRDRSGDSRRYARSAAGTRTRPAAPHARPPEPQRQLRIAAGVMGFVA